MKGSAERLRAVGAGAGHESLSASLNFSGVHARRPLVERPGAGAGVWPAPGRDPLFESPAGPFHAS